MKDSIAMEVERNDLTTPHTYCAVTTGPSEAIAPAIGVSFLSLQDPQKPPESHR